MAEKKIDINNLLDQIIKVTGLTQEEIASRINYRSDYLSQARNAGTQKLYDKLVSFMEEFGKSKLSKDGEERPVTVYDLILNNRVLSEANRTLADAHKLLADAHNRLVRDNDNLVQLAREVLSINLDKSLTNNLAPQKQAVNTVAAEKEIRRTGRTGSFSMKVKDGQQDSLKKKGS